MPLGLPKLASTVKNLEAILVSTSSDDILFDSWSHDGKILTNEDAAGYLGLFVRTRIEVLDALGFERGPLQASIETDGRIILFRHIEDQFHLVFIFNAGLPYGLARVQAEKLKSALAAQLLDTPLPKQRIETTHPVSPPKPLLDISRPETPLQKTPATVLKTEDSRPDVSPEIMLERDVFHLPQLDLNTDAPATANEAVFFDHEFVDHAPEPVVNDDVVFAIGNIESDQFEADMFGAADPSQSALPADNSSPANDEGTTMSTHYTIHQEETVIVRSTVQGNVETTQTQQLQQIQRELNTARLRMTYEGGRPDAEPVDTPTERGRRRPSAIIGKQRMANEGGPVRQYPVDTPTENDSHAQAHTAKQRMANEGGPVRQRPVDTPTEDGNPEQAERAGARMVDEGGQAHTDPEYARARVPHHEQDIVSSVRRGSEPKTRAQTLIEYVTANVSNPNTAHARLAIHSHVPLELLLAPHSLNAEQVRQLEDAARIILGVSQLPV